MGGCVGDERREFPARVWCLRAAPPSTSTCPVLPGPPAGVTGTYTSMIFCSSVRPAPSMVKVQPNRGMVRGFRRDASATSLRFCLGSPRIWKTGQMSGAALRKRSLEALKGRQGPSLYLLQFGPALARSLPTSAPVSSLENMDVHGPTVRLHVTRGMEKVPPLF